MWSLDKARKGGCKTCTKVVLLTRIRSVQKCRHPESLILYKRTLFHSLCTIPGAGLAIRQLSAPMLAKKSHQRVDFLRQCPVSGIDRDVVVAVPAVVVVAALLPSAFHSWPQRFRMCGVWCVCPHSFFWLQSLEAIRPSDHRSPPRPRGQSMESERGGGSRLLGKEIVPGKPLALGADLVQIVEAGNTALIFFRSWKYFSRENVPDFSNTTLTSFPPKSEAPRPPPLFHFFTRLF